MSRIQNTWTVFRIFMRLLVTKLQLSLNEVYESRAFESWWSQGNEGCDGSMGHAGDEPWFRRCLLRRIGPRDPRFLPSLYQARHVCPFFSPFSSSGLQHVVRRVESLQEHRMLFEWTNEYLARYLPPMHLLLHSKRRSKHASIRLSGICKRNFTRDGWVVRKKDTATSPNSQDVLVAICFLTERRFFVACFSDSSSSHLVGCDCSVLLPLSVFSNTWHLSLKYFEIYEIHLRIWSN